MIWRLVTHETMRGQSYKEITETWLIEEVLDANTILTAYDNAHRAQQQELDAQREQG